MKTISWDLDGAEKQLTLRKTSKFVRGSKWIEFAQERAVESVLQRCPDAVPDAEFGWLLVRSGVKHTMRSDGDCHRLDPSNGRSEDNELT